MSLSVFLREHKNKEKASFHMPGHKGRKIFDDYGMTSEIDGLVDCDITEIPGADNLFVHDGVIRSIMDRYKKLYGSVETFLSVGGSSAGIIASILATVKAGDDVIVPRNCHRSVFHGITLANAKPVVVYPEVYEDCHIYGRMQPETIADVIKEGSVVLVTSPNYYGICSDISAIARVVRAKGGILIVDQAHGAHLKFMNPELSADLPGKLSAELSAELSPELSADRTGYIDAAASQNDPFLQNMPDIVIESTHKTMATFTQTAIVNIYNEKLAGQVEEKLRLIESTSPSYILLESMELNARLIEEFGDEIFAKWKDDLDYFYEAAKNIQGLRVMDIPYKDRTKIVIDAASIGVAAKALEEELLKRGIYGEFTSGNLYLGMSGIGNVRSDYVILIEALKDIKSNADQIMKEYAGENPEGDNIISDRYGTQMVNKDNSPLPAPGELLEI